MTETPPKYRANPTRKRPAKPPRPAKPSMQETHSEARPGAHYSGTTGGDADPTGKSPHELGAKLDAGKPDLSLLLDFGLALAEVAKVATYGAKKYSRGGWQHVPDGQDRYAAALLRHLLADSSRDQESGLLHDAQVAWNALARLELALRAAKDVPPC